jgi:hypothetical protein
MFDQPHLTALGFEGFQPLSLFAATQFAAPASPGIYAVLLAGSDPGFLARSVGGHFKGSDPTVAIDELASKWLEDVATLYIGRANNLRGRVTLLARYGNGEPVAHRGGRYLWQLATHSDLLVAWKLDDDPVRAETDLLDEFECAFGRLPFANLVRGTRTPAYV